MANIKLSILIPVRNEGVNIGIMVKVLEALVEVPHEVLVIYDFPEDDTIPIVKKLQPRYGKVRLVHNTLGRGVKNAILSGVQASLGDYILIFAADEVGPSLIIDDMLALMDQGCDMVSATRYAHGGRRLGGSLIEGTLSLIGNKLFHDLSGSVFTDSTTGIKMFHKSLLQKLRLEAKPIGWAIVFELGIKAQLVGQKFGEVSIMSIDRLYGGKSTFAAWSWFREYFRWALWGFRNLRGKKKPQLVVRVPSSTAN